MATNVINIIWTKVASTSDYFEKCDCFLVDIESILSSHHSQNDYVLFVFVVTAM